MSSRLKPHDKGKVYGDVLGEGLIVMEGCGCPCPETSAMGIHPSPVTLFII
jgi:hypothetical protein